jgi:hypothetical protein
VQTGHTKLLTITLQVPWYQCRPRSAGTSMDVNMIIALFAIQSIMSYFHNFAKNNEWICPDYKMD